MKITDEMIDAAYALTKEKIEEYHQSYVTGKHVHGSEQRVCQKQAHEANFRAVQLSRIANARYIAELQNKPPVYDVYMTEFLQNNPEMAEINVDQIMKKHGNNAFWIFRALYDIMDFPNVSYERSIEYSNSGAKNILDHAMAHVMNPNMKSRYWTSSVPE
jgi:hypothetical protein